jgi:uncharacterized membrane protein YeaQ/YmgE (transglycosylase-associated protein family)
METLGLVGKPATRGVGVRGASWTARLDTSNGDETGAAGPHGASGAPRRMPGRLGVAPAAAGQPAHGLFPGATHVYGLTMCPVIAYLLSLLVVGFLIGVIARFLLPGPDPMGCLATALLGIVGSFVGGLLADVLFRHSGRSGALHPAGFIGSVAGAMVVLLLLRLLRGSRRR